MFTNTQQENGNPSYQIATSVFEGPLDLLLRLIERSELDITQLALAQVTNQFLLYIKNLEEFSAEEVSGFLLIATRLMQIKSESLLPRPPEREAGEEDEGQLLVQQLIIYKRYKEISTILAQNQKEGLHTYLRLAPPPKVEGKLDLSNVTIQDLRRAAERIFAKAQDFPSLSTIVRKPLVTIREKISQITSIIQKSATSTFRQLLGNKTSRIDVVVTFLAMLELVKRYRIQATQKNLFGVINISRAEQWQEDMDFEIEFTE